MQVVRVGDKLISLDRIHMMVEQALRLRAQGESQAEVAVKLGLDRPLLSRLETLGEVRHAQRVAVVGFPIANGGELTRIAQDHGVEYTWFMTDQERRQFAESLSGAELIDRILHMAAEVRQFDAVVLLASNERIHQMRALLEPSTLVVPMVLGATPLHRDVAVDPEAFLAVIGALGPRRKGSSPSAAGEP